VSVRGSRGSQLLLRWNRYDNMLSFQKLDVYQRSIEFLAFVRRLLPQLPKGHADLADQLRRSAQSTPQNIAEGAGRISKLDKARHYTIARGSAMESAAHLDVMKVDGLVDDQQYHRGIELLERVVAMLTKLIDPSP
jgi:four helix bundle protein